MVGLSACGSSNKAGSDAAESSSSRSAARTTTTATQSTASSSIQASTRESTEAKILRFVQCMHTRGIAVPLLHTSHGLAVNLQALNAFTSKNRRIARSCLQQ